MRIITGTLGGRFFASPQSKRTHPMSDKMRGAVFNVLGDISGLRVLDPFAGTGALSFEAISRGAASAVLIEVDQRASNTIQKNCDLLDISEKVSLVHASCGVWSDKNKDQQFDIILCDPPYDAPHEELLQKLTRHLKDDGVFILSWPIDSKLPPPALIKLFIVKQKKYGDSQLIFYKIQ